MNKELDETLKHFGVKGMKWGVKNDNKDSSDDSSGGGPDEEEFLQNLLDTLGIKMEDLGDEAKKLGKDFLASIFGESKPTSKIIDPSKVKSIGDLKKVNLPMPKSSKPKDKLTKQLESQGLHEVKNTSKDKWKMTTVIVGSKEDKKLQEKIKKGGYTEHYQKGLSKRMKDLKKNWKFVNK